MTSTSDPIQGSLTSSKPDLNQPLLQESQISPAQEDNHQDVLEIVQTLPDENDAISKPINGIYSYIKDELMFQRW